MAPRKVCVSGVVPNLDFVLNLEICSINHGEGKSHQSKREYEKKTWSHVHQTTTKAHQACD